MSQALESAFQRLLGRIPTAEEREVLYRVRDALGLGPDDAMWSVMIAMQYHLDLYRKIPKRIETAARRSTEEARELIREDFALAQLKLEEARERTVATLSGDIAEGVERQFKRAIVGRQRLLTLGAVLTISGVLLTLISTTFFAGYVVGAGDLRGWEAQWQSWFGANLIQVRLVGSMPVGYAIYALLIGGAVSGVLLAVLAAIRAILSYENDR